MPLYPASRGFFLLWLLVIMKSFTWLDCHVSTMRQTNHANDFINAKSQVREKPLLAGYCLYKIFPIHPWVFFFLGICIYREYTLQSFQMKCVLKIFDKIFNDFIQLYVMLFYWQLRGNKASRLLHAVHAKVSWTIYIKNYRF